MAAALGAVERLAVHHSASPQSWTASRIRRLHVEENGWPTIAYHAVIETTGRIVQGVALHQIGRHVAGRNRGTIGVCVVGDNTTPDPSSEKRWRRSDHAWNTLQIAALRRYVAAALVLYPHLDVGGHRDFSEHPTACPGVNVRRLLAPVLLA